MYWFVYAVSEFSMVLFSYKNAHTTILYLFLCTCGRVSLWHRVCTYLALLEIAKLLPKVDVKIYASTSSHMRLPVCLQPCQPCYWQTLKLLSRLGAWQIFNCDYNFALSWILLKFKIFSYIHGLYMVVRPGKWVTYLLF